MSTDIATTYPCGDSLGTCMRVEVADAMGVVHAELGSKVEDYRRRFRDAAPFPHVVVDGVFPEAVLTALVDEFPEPSDAVWARSAVPDIQVKLRSDWRSERDIAPVTRHVVHYLNSGEFMTWLSSVSGVDHLISDPYFTGGGLNCVLPGGVLDVHVDGNWHDAMAVHRRLNAILFLNRDWRPEWGGDLELWDEALSGPVTTIAPVYNRLVVFETHDRTYHGHPSPLACPSGLSRKSLILYYYTAAPRPPAHVTRDAPHRALWRRMKLQEWS